MAACRDDRSRFPPNPNAVLLPASVCGDIRDTSFWVANPAPNQVPRRSIAKSSFSLRTSAKQPTSHYIIHRASGFFWLFNHRSDRETKRRTALEPTQATGYEDTIIALSMG
ncbi:hypothetical protein CIHG_00553 [Coccidioides immitis H538.4]|uniref:Uncharacterized protein n=2 Tax=Coccidioides immitis TaxID=5501 RepID=A0A0J8RDX4_COCIT|nr:hypothetical protein CIRG_07365 [Coccidioides immitis RMSCC 2394]KMU82771.1 hypothetical protein CIHG_00553 [Coccidioides immitis H538.4]